MGSPAFALPTLEALLAAGHQLVAVYSQPPKPANRGQKITPCAVHAFAEERGLTVFTPESFKHEQTVKEFAELKPDVAVVVAYGLILPKAILDIPTYGCLNLHPSLLPKWRGAAPVQWPILNGETETAATIMQMNEGCDTGDILLYRKVEITPESTTASMQEQLSQLGAELMAHALVGLQHRLLTPIKQNDKEATYARKLEREDGKIEWKSMKAIKIERMVRALNPWPGAYFQFNGEYIKILKAQALPFEGRLNPGEVMTAPEITGGAPLCITTADGLLRVDELQRPNRRPVAADEFMNGVSMPDGTLLP
jgi:methionyl-tRNA formyltransferase